MAIPYESDAAVAVVTTLGAAGVLTSTATTVEAYQLERYTEFPEATTLLAPLRVLELLTWPTIEGDAEEETSTTVSPS